MYAHTTCLLFGSAKYVLIGRVVQFHMQTLVFLHIASILFEVPPLFGPFFDHGKPNFVALLIQM